MNIPYKQLKPGKTITTFGEDMIPVKVDKKLFSKYPAMTDKQKLLFLKMCRFIETNCGQYLKEVKETKKFLYRGTTDFNDRTIYFMGNPRKNRRSRDTGENVQDAVDILMKLSGMSALRSNSIFCTSDYSTAHVYGDGYIIFPIDGFSFSWSKANDWIIQPEDVIDCNIAFKKLERTLYLLWDKLRQIELPVSKSTTSDENILEKIIDCWYDLDVPDELYDKSILEFFNDAMKDITTSFILYFSLVKKYPEINIVSEKLLTKIKQLMILSVNTKLIANNFVKKYKLTNKDLSIAMKFKKEVCISGQYIAIKAFDDLLKKYFKL